MLHAQNFLTFKSEKIIMFQRKFILIVIFSYFIAGISIGFLNVKDEEVFPFFSWSLFSRIPNRGYQYSVQITEYNGQIIKPVLFQKASSIVNKSHSSEPDRIIQNMGKNFDKNTQEFEKMKNLLEGNYLGNTTKYNLVLLTYDPLQKWKTGKQNIRILG